jgi:hypothetical protein
MEIQTVSAGNERKTLIKISAQLVWIACFARIVSSHGKAASQFLSRTFKPSHVIALPTMQRDGYAAQRCQSLVHVNANLGVPFLGKCIRLFNTLG